MLSNSTLLRNDYEAFLNMYGVVPRSAAAGLQSISSMARARGEITLADEIDASLSRVESSETPLHPAQKALEEVCDMVVSSIPNDTEGRARNIYVGEFPHGEINAISTTSEHGYLVLVNSGLIVAVKQVVQGLALEDCLRTGLEPSDRVIDSIAAVLRAYADFGDPMYGPLILAQRDSQGEASALWWQILRFAVGHEYAHVFLGHFESGATIDIDSPVGTLTALEKSWYAEFEADLGSYLWITDWLQRRSDTFSARAAASPDGVNLSVGELSCLAAPFACLEIFNLIEAVANQRHARSGSANSHPPSSLRIRALLEEFPATPSLALIAPGLLAQIADRVQDRALGMSDPQLSALRDAYTKSDTEQQVRAATAFIRDAPR